MKSIDNMSQAELAAYVHEHLRNSGIYIVLSGDAAVGIYSDGAYVSKDIDFVNAGFASRKKIEKSMGELGFIPEGRHFKHPESDHIVEFTPGPLQFGDGRVKNVSELDFDTGTLQIISPTDCIKDRLAHYYHWGDRQCLKQAILVASKHNINYKELQEWSKSEGKLDEFKKVKNDLEKE
jgi:hypothetical protein